LKTRLHLFYTILFYFLQPLSAHAYSGGCRNEECTAPALFLAAIGLVFIAISIGRFIKKNGITKKLLDHTGVQILISSFTAVAIFSLVVVALIYFGIII